MPLRKTPISSLSVIKLLVKRVWYLSQTGIQRIRPGSTPETSTTPASPASRLHLELVQEIMAYLSDDKHSLRTCSLTCYSWYIASISHLHYALVVDPNLSGEFQWPNPLLHMHALGLLPLVEVVWIRGRRSPRAFSSELLDNRILRQFHALSNVRQLMIEYLDIPTFMPSIRRNIRHFLPTVQHLSLREPKGSRRQIIYFIGLFQHLDDLRLLYDEVNFDQEYHERRQEEPVDDPTLVPPFVPPLRGSLTLSCFTRVSLLRDMVKLFGGLRFRHMSLFYVYWTRLLLDACAQTLESLQLDSTDPLAKSALGDIGLSQNKSLRRLRIVARATTRWGDDSHRAAADLLRRAISTVTPPTSLEVMIVTWKYDFCGVDPWAGEPPFCGAPQAEVTDEAPLHLRRSTYHRVSEEVDTWFLSCAYAWELTEKCSIWIEPVEEGRGQKGFDHLPELVATYFPRRIQF